VLKSIFGLVILVVTSGSMSPAIYKGSVVFVLPQEPYKLNNIITYNYNQKLITHRIIGIKNESFITKGDANNTEDLNKVELDQIKGKVVFYIPFLGYPKIIINDLLGLID